MTFTSSGSSPIPLQKVSVSRIVADIIKLLLHFVNTDLQKGETSRGFNSTLTTSSPSNFISETIQLSGLKDMLSIVNSQFLYVFFCLYQKLLIFNRNLDIQHYIS